MKRLTTDQWMGIGLGIMAAGILALAVLDMGKAGRALVQEGKPMPAIAGRLVGGEEMRLEEGDTGGTVLLVDFWASWCPACVGGLRHLGELREELDGRPFGLLTVNLDQSRNQEEQEALVREFLRGQELDLPVLLDDGSIQKAFGAYTLPTVYLIGRDGKIRKSWAGAPPERALRREIDAALADGGEQ